MNNLSVSNDTYENNRILSGTVLMVQSLDGNELQYDTLDATIDLGTFVPTIFKPIDSDGILTTENELFGVRPLFHVLVTDPSIYKYGEEVIYKHRGVLVGKYYMTSITRVGKTQYRISCVSPIGLLSNSQHYGGIYSGIAFSELVSEIIGGIVPFSVEQELANQPVYGWLPVASRRDNLHQALFAMGAAAKKDDNGDLVFGSLSNEIHEEIPNSRVFSSGTVAYPDAVTLVSISEHTFLSHDTDETATLFEGSVSAERITTPSGVVTSGSVILFGSPMHDLSVTGTTIIESTVNYAVLAPSSDCKLFGKKYTHTVREVTRPESADSASTEKENKITVSDATLVSFVNSESVADRLMSYYSSAKTVSNDIVVDTERAGSAVRVTDPFGDTTKGIIKSLDINMSNTLKAHAEIVSDYSPGGAGNYYSDVAVISESGSWAVPSGISRIRVAIIGGGSGGYSGTNGEDGERGERQTNFGESFSGTNGKGGKGGSKGAGGSGGKILVKTIDVSAGQTFSISIGRGGAGGVCNGYESQSGYDGEDTIFGQFSSADGTRSAAGYTDLFNGLSYGVSGVPGVDGGNGNSGGSSSGADVIGDTITIGGITYSPGADGKRYTSAKVSGYGGLGGGAAVGSNGGDGEDGDRTKEDGYETGFGGRGGDGANATAPSSVGLAFGNGGTGGNGGGGGGGGGSGRCSASAYASVSPGNGGKGGKGSSGSSGSNGCVLIYF